MGFTSDKKPDAAFGLSHQPGTLSIIRSMESAHYYQENNLAQARRWVSTVLTRRYTFAGHVKLCD